MKEKGEKEGELSSNNICRVKKEKKQARMYRRHAYYVYTQ